MSGLPPIEHDPTGQRFVARVDGLTCEVIYHLEGDLMSIVHTGVPRPLEGRGIAAVLVAAALDHARSNGLHVRPMCSYVRAYMRRHPATQDLLA